VIARMQCTQSGEIYTFSNYNKLDVNERYHYQLGISDILKVRHRSDHS
jgi:hypothetical protein